MARNASLITDHPSLLMGEYVFRGRLISVRVEETERGPREVVEHPGAVAILALNERGEVLLVRQHRYGAGRALWEIPAGTLEPGESPLRCAQRELWEETGLRARRWRKLGTFYTSPGILNELMHLFLAEGLEGDLEPQLKGEIAELCFRDPREVLEEAAQGEPGDGKTLAALAFLLSRFGGGKGSTSLPFSRACNRPTHCDPLGGGSVSGNVTGLEAW